jgi:hypothetical protein
VNRGEKGGAAKLSVRAWLERQAYAGKTEAIF